jgi:hypothetical protein
MNFCAIPPIYDRVSAFAHTLLQRRRAPIALAGMLLTIACDPGEDDERSESLEQVDKPVDKLDIVELMALGKADGWDTCAEYSWYGDGECDLFCPSPDPDCTPPSPATCTNTCSYAHDDECDDGSPGSSYSLCPLGSDCADCSGSGGSTGHTTGCSNTCSYANDDVCDDGSPGSSYSLCTLGTDCADCSGSPPAPTPTPTPTPSDDRTWHECYRDCTDYSPQSVGLWTAGLAHSPWELEATIESWNSACEVYNCRACGTVCVGQLSPPSAPPL